jgi:hypothetical protein
MPIRRVVDAIDFPEPLVGVLALSVPHGDGAPARAVAIEGLR